MTQSFSFSHFPISSRAALSNRNTMWTTSANDMCHFTLPSSYLIKEICEVHVNSILFSTTYTKIVSCQHVINQDRDPLQGHTYGNFCVPSMPRESWVQLGSADSTSLPNHEGRFLLEPKQEKGGNFCFRLCSRPNMPPTSGTYTLERD